MTSSAAVRVAGIAALAVTALAAVLALAAPGLGLPVSVDLAGLGTDGSTGRRVLAVVDGRLAVLLPVAAAGALLLARRGGLLVTGVAAPVVVFLVAQLNGVTDLGALVLTYAVAAGSVLLRAAGTVRGVRLAGMLGIVPWGVIAFHQIGALVVGSPLPAGVAVTTLAVLTATIAEYVVAALRAGSRAAEVLPALPAAVLAILATAAIV